MAQMAVIVIIRLVHNNDNDNDNGNDNDNDNTAVRAAASWPHVLVLSSLCVPCCSCACIDGIIFTSSSSSPLCCESAPTQAVPSAQWCNCLCLRTLGSAAPRSCQRRSPLSSSTCAPRCCWRNTADQQIPDSGHLDSFDCNQTSMNLQTCPSQTCHGPTEQQQQSPAAKIATKHTSSVSASFWIFAQVWHVPCCACTIPQPASWTGAGITLA